MDNIGERSAIVRKTLKSLNTNLEYTLFDCAELLYEAQFNKYFSHWGYKNLAEYAAQELQMKPRRAQYLARIVRVAKAVGLTRDSYEKAAVSKLREIATLDPEASWFNPETKLNEALADCILDLFLQANDLTLDQIRKLVSLYKGQVGPDRRIIRSYSTNESAYEKVIKPAMELTRRRLGSAGRDDAGNAKDYSDGVVIEMWAAEVLADPNYLEPSPIPEEKNDISSRTIDHEPVGNIEESPHPIQIEQE